MDLLKKYWPHAFKADSIVSLVVTIIVYALIDVVLGWVIGLVSLIPIIGLLCSLAGSLLGLYCIVGMILAVLHFFKVLK